MNNIQIRNLSILIFILINIEVNAQSDFKSGYVILNNSDTLFGKIDSRGDRTMSKTCRFKPTNSDLITEYSPRELNEYQFIGSKRYVSRTLESGIPVFLEYLIKGKLNVYYYVDGEGKDHYLIDKEGFPLKVIPYKEGFRFREDGTRVLYQSTYHVGILQAYTNDANDFNKESLKIVRPDHKNLIKYAEDYHNAVCQDEECIIYEKNVPFIKVSIELFYGKTFFNIKHSDNIKTSDFGSFIYLWLPRASERLYFKTGIIYVYIKDVEVEYALKIPSQLTYQYSHFRLRPNFSFGLNHYILIETEPAYSWTFSAGIGLDYKIYKNISVSGNFNTDFTPIAFSIVHDSTFDLVSYSFNFGIRIDL